jgi:hypothetical protein
MECWKDGMMGELALSKVKERNRNRPSVLSALDTH